jgi:hypothetical protein
MNWARPVHHFPARHSTPIGFVGAAAPASAAPPAGNNRPAATATADVPVDDTVVVRYEINRGLKQIAQPVSCTLDNVATDCGLQQSSTKKLTSYATTLTALPGGSHTFQVTFTLTDGGVATAVAEFSIEDTPLTLEETCATMLVGGGVLTLTPGESSSWLCTIDGFVASAEEVGEGFDLLTPFCPSSFMGQYRIDEITTWYCVR